MGFIFCGFWFCLFGVWGGKVGFFGKLGLGFGFGFLFVCFVFCLVGFGFLREAIFGGMGASFFVRVFFAGSGGVGGVRRDYPVDLFHLIPCNLHILHKQVSFY